MADDVSESNGSFFLTTEGCRPDARPGFRSCPMVMARWWGQGNPSSYCASMNLHPRQKLTNSAMLLSLIALSKSNICVEVAFLSFIAKPFCLLREMSIL